MKKLEKNPIHLYVGQICAICDTDQPVQDKIEGCDFERDLIISERTNYDPSIIKPILRDISDITKEEALEAANIVWFAIGNKKIEDVEIKTTPIFPYAAIYFNWNNCRSGITAVAYCASKPTKSGNNFWGFIICFSYNLQC